MISALLTDFYQLTMAYGYWKLAKQDDEAVFHLIFRKHPFQGNYVVACGLEPVIEMLLNWRFQEAELTYLAQLTGKNHELLFSPGFIDYLAQLRFTCDV